MTRDAKKPVAGRKVRDGLLMMKGRRPFETD
jgi:hypothetical protein